MESSNSYRSLLYAHVQRTKSLRNVSFERLPVGWKVTVTIITPFKQELGTHRRMADGRMLTEYEYDMSKEIAEERASYEILIAIAKAYENGEYSPFVVDTRPMVEEQARC